MPKSEATLPDIEQRRKRARYRAWHRGTKELDMILGQYADTHLAEMTAKGLAQFETLIAEEETTLQSWLMGQTEMPQDWRGKLLTHIRQSQLKAAEKFGGGAS